MPLRAYAGNREILPGEIITSRLGERYVFSSATHATTPAAFGKIVVRRIACVTRDGHVVPMAYSSTFSDIAFSVTVRG